MEFYFVEDVTYFEEHELEAFAELEYEGEE